ncbi:MAG TPA: hypothetical protein VK140_14700 [Ktedonobacteraceae bacterium]|nr:hypothetical protein [Ktedonobacteraceae bacterium]
MMTSISDIQRVFVDSLAWIDLMNKNERHHAAAVAFHKSLAPMTLRVTTWGIVSETFTWIVELYPFFTEHQAKTTRQIPVVALERR